MCVVKGQGHVWPSNFKGQDYGHGQTHWSNLRPGVQSICLLFVSWQSDHFWLRYRKFHIWPWKSKVKVMAKIKPDGHIWGLGVQWICLLFVPWQSDHFWLRYSKFHIWPWKFKVKVMAKIKPDGHIWGPRVQSICLRFRFVAIGPFLAEIKQIPYLTLKNLGQGQDKNRPKSNQVIYRSGPRIVPKMKESKKLFKSYRVDKSCGRRRTNRYKNIKSPRYTGVT